MKLVVISCWKYRDAWKPFFALLEHFWPEHPKTWLLTDYLLEFDYHLPESINVFSCGSPSYSWCDVLLTFLAENDGESVLLMQEDFFLTAKVNDSLIRMAETLLKDPEVGAVRLYPCPGANVESSSPYWGKVSKFTPYRISCQATVWHPAFLANIAINCITPWDFEIVGSPFADGNLKEDVLAFKREVQPWPMNYLCSGISRGLWNPDSKRLCDRLGIENNWSMRPMAIL